MTMHADLWSFTLDFYAQPGVEQACLTLQASGANVCALLCGVWLDQHRVRFDQQHAAQIGQLASGWDVQVVKPLRELRTHWKPLAVADRELGALRDRLKTLELDAERELLARLERVVAERESGQDTQSGDVWLIALAGQAANLAPDALQTLLRAGTSAA